MSLNKQQKVDAIAEFDRAFAQLGVSSADAARALDTTPARIEQVARLRSRRIEEPWVLRNYLIGVAREAHVAVPRFSVLAGDFHRYWFLDAGFIERASLA